MYSKLDAIVGQLGEPVGLKTYIPFNSQGEDHLEDYLGMIGVPMEPVCDFPADAAKILLTASALKDEKILEKTQAFVLAGGNAIVTSGFIIGALKKWPEQLEKLTSVSYRDRTLTADEFQYTVNGQYGRNFVKAASPITFPLIEHRNNATWSIMNAGHGEYHESIICYDTFGKGRLTILNVPDMPSKLYELPVQVLTQIRQELDATGVTIDGAPGVSLFVYDNNTFGLYCHTWDGCTPQEFDIHIKGEVKELTRVLDGEKPMPWNSFPLEPVCTRKISMRSQEKETLFHTRIQPGEFWFFKY
jgi:hypothetical protein